MNYNYVPKLIRSKKLFIDLERDLRFEIDSLSRELHLLKDSKKDEELKYASGVKLSARLKTLKEQYVLIRDSYNNVCDFLERL